MPTALYPGTFDPVTNGHVDVAVRAARIFTKVIAVIADNPVKNTLFTADERVEMAREALKDVKNVEVVRYSGLIVNCMTEYNATVIIRGLRALSDFEYEFQMAFTNRNMSDRAETVFLTPSVEYVYLNSTLVKQIARHGGTITQFVPANVAAKLAERMQQANGTR